MASGEPKSNVRQIPSGLRPWFYPYGRCVGTPRPLTQIRGCFFVE